MSLSFKAVLRYRVHAYVHGEPHTLCGRPSSFLPGNGRLQRAVHPPDLLLRLPEEPGRRRCAACVRAIHRAAA